VFASVMTGNIVLFGLALARGSGYLAGHTAVAIASYCAGVAAGVRIIGQHETDEWPPRIYLALGAELMLLGAVLAGWEATGAKPAGAAQYLLLACLAIATGIQSAAVPTMGIHGVSTTFLTGTLTSLVATIARPGQPRWPGLRRPGVLAGLVTGAVLAGLFLATVPAVVPVLPFVALIGVIFLARRPRPRPRPH
jgi:uncharacterized membrane protein YoaK (UPF0700 family)